MLYGYVLEKYRDTYVKKMAQHIIFIKHDNIYSFGYHVSFVVYSS